MNGFNNQNNNITGLSNIYCDNIYSNDVISNNYNSTISSQELLYSDGLTSNIQNQINSIVTNISSGGGYFLVNAEKISGFASGYIFSFGASGSSNLPIVFGFPCNLLQF